MPTYELETITDCQAISAAAAREAKPNTGHTPSPSALPRGEPKSAVNTNTGGERG